MYLILLFLQADATNLRRSTRKRRASVNLEGYTDSSGYEDEDIMVRIYTLLSIPF